MKRITRLIAVIVGAAAFAMSFAACGNNDGGGDGGATEPEKKAVVTLDKNHLTLQRNASYKLSATSTEEGDFVWATDEEGVAYVSKNGEVTGLNVGSAVISVTCGNASDYCQVTVTETGEVSVDDEVKKDGYIYYEDFAGRREVPGYLRQSVTGGGYSSVSNENLILGTTGGGSAFASYIFDEALSGKIVAETRVKVGSTAFSNILFFYRGEAGYDNNDIIACLGMDAGGFKNHNGSGWSGSITGYSVNTWYDIKMVLDIGNGQYELYINGKQYAKQSFRKTGDGVEDRIKLLKFGTDKSGGELTYDYISISQGSDEYAPEVEAETTTVAHSMENGNTVVLNYRALGNPTPEVTVTSSSTKATVGEDKKTVTFAPDTGAGVYEISVKAENTLGYDVKTFKIIIREDASELLNADFASGSNCGFVFNSSNGSSGIVGENLVMTTNASGGVLATAMYDFGEVLTGKVLAKTRVKNDSPDGTFMNILFLYRAGSSSIDARRCNSSIAFNNGKLQYHNGSGWQELAPVTRGEWVEIEVLYDFDLYTTEIKLNGVSLGTVSMRTQRSDTQVLIIGSDKTNANITYDYITFTKVTEETNG